MWIINYDEKDGYIKDNLEERLKVTRSLGIYKSRAWQTLGRGVIRPGFFPKRCALLWDNWGFFIQ